MMSQCALKGHALVDTDSDEEAYEQEEGLDEKRQHEEAQQEEEQARSRAAARTSSSSDGSGTPSPPRSVCSACATSLVCCSLSLCSVAKSSLPGAWLPGHYTCEPRSLRPAAGTRVRVPRSPSNGPALRSTAVGSAAVGCRGRLRALAARVPSSSLCPEPVPPSRCPCSSAIAASTFRGSFQLSVDCLSSAVLRLPFGFSVRVFGVRASCKRPYRKYAWLQTCSNRLQWGSVVCISVPQSA